MTHQSRRDQRSLTARSLSVGNRNVSLTLFPDFGEKRAAVVIR